MIHSLISVPHFQPLWSFSVPHSQPLRSTLCYQFLTPNIYDPLTDLSSSLPTFMNPLTVLSSLLPSFMIHSLFSVLHSQPLWSTHCSQFLTPNLYDPLTVLSSSLPTFMIHSLISVPHSQPLWSTHCSQFLTPDLYDPLTVLSSSLPTFMSPLTVLSSSLPTFMIHSLFPVPHSQPFWSTSLPTHHFLTPNCNNFLILTITILLTPNSSFPHI